MVAPRCDVKKIPRGPAPPAESIEVPKRSNNRGIPNKIEGDSPPNPPPSYIHAGNFHVAPFKGRLDISDRARVLGIDVSKGDIRYRPFACDCVYFQRRSIARLMPQGRNPMANAPMKRPCLFYFLYQWSSLRVDRKREWTEREI